MSPERFPPDDPREWLNRARSSLALAKTRPPEAYLEDLCFEAQQAAEKAIKALLIRHGVAFPYVHDLARLLTVLEEAGEVVPATIREAEGLTRYAVVTRYPGLAEPVTEAQYEETMAAAEAVVRWAANRLRELG
jgi:HEPN domain-containing protein